MLLFDERHAVTEYAKKMLSTGLVKGTGGNISLANADKNLLAITPSGVPYETMVPEDVVVVDMEGHPGKAQSSIKITPPVQQKPTQRFNAAS